MAVEVWEESDVFLAISMWDEDIDLSLESLKRPFYSIRLVSL
jgi:hypothetical protein